MWTAYRQLVKVSKAVSLVVSVIVWSVGRFGSDATVLANDGCEQCDGRPGRGDRVKVE